MCLKDKANTSSNPPPPSRNNQLSPCYKKCRVSFHSPALINFVTYYSLQSKKNFYCLVAFLFNCERFPIILSSLRSEVTNHHCMRSRTHKSDYLKYKSLGLNEESITCRTGQDWVGVLAFMLTISQKKNHLQKMHNPTSNSYQLTCLIKVNVENGNNNNNDK